MSSDEQRDPENPVRSRGEEERSGGGEEGLVVAPGKKRLRRREPKLVLDVDTETVSIGELSWIERIRRSAFSGGVGLAVSVLVHGVILVILGLIVLQSRTINNDPFTVTWSTTIEPAEREAREKRRTITIPIDVASIATTPSTTMPEKTTTTQTETTAAVGVHPVNVSQALSGRSQGSRDSSLEQLGGSNDTERAIKAGLGWLARQQTSDGHWELHQGYPDAGRSYIKTDTGATALALLAFLGQGQTHQTGEHQKVVAKGLNWLRTIQDRTSGDLHDQRQEEGRNGAFYAHSMGTIVLCEALAITGDSQFRPAAELAVKYLIDSQHPDLGGWKYRPLNLRVMSGDLSVTAWALMALHSARIAGISVPVEEFERSSRFLDRVQESGGSRYKYEPDDPAGRVTPARTAIGLLCRQWLGWPKSHPPMMDGIQFLMEARHRPEWSAGRRNVFEWYYITQVMHNVGGDDWKLWYKAVRDAVIRNQVTGGSAKPGQGHTRLMESQTGR